MGWGSNVFTYDRAWSVRLFSGVSRSLEQVGAIVQGVHPPVRLLVDTGNQAQAQALWRLHWHLLFVVGLTLVCVLALLACLGAWVFQQRRSTPATPNGGLAHEGR